MIVLYIVYALLIGTAVVIVPLRVRARRRTLRELDALRSAFHHSMQQLVDKMEARTVEAPSEREQSVTLKTLQSPLERLRDEWDVFVYPKAEKVVCYYSFQPQKPRSREPLHALLARLESPEHFWEQVEQVDIWLVDKGFKQPALPTGRRYSKALATI